LVSNLLLSQLLVLVLLVLLLPLFVGCEEGSFQGGGCRQGQGCP
jgi:hypothetical protein